MVTTKDVISNQATKDLTCIIVGGGYAGIHAVKALQQLLRAGVGDRRLNGDD